MPSYFVAFSCIIRRCKSMQWQALQICNIWHCIELCIPHARIALKCIACIIFRKEINIEKCNDVIDRRGVGEFRGVSRINVMTSSIDVELNSAGYPEFLVWFS